ncbi:MAG: tRNA (uridine(54)-C5)-methyltransferase TrmA [Campylobacterota bacterium]|nr:tRNA (uridine(54)-C5)-methyltransferase TrmA [Campylobacterota bacterium]
MDCKYFGECGSCREYENGYDFQLNKKLSQTKEEFEDMYINDIVAFVSPESHYRARSEFRIWHDGDAISYAMNSQKPKTTLMIDECPMVAKSIFSLMPPLIIALKEYEMDKKLFGADFLSASSGEIVVSLLYHRRLDDVWKEKAKALSEELGIHIIGRSRKQKEVLTQDYVTETLHVSNRDFYFRHIENSFTQPNPKVNEAMISWALEKFEGLEGDLLELYCGAGNFTIPFATVFNKILATEISKSSINAAKVNMQLNKLSNIDFVRLSVEEFVEAMDEKRIFRRLEGLDLKAYDFKAIFVDPPRSGMDVLSSEFSTRFDTIVYISCNPETLKRDLDFLTQTHEIKDMVLFDQFPYTHHREMGVKLIKKC